MPCVARRPAKVSEIISLCWDLGHTNYTHRLIYTVQTNNYENKISTTDTSVISLGFITGIYALMRDFNKHEQAAVQHIFYQWQTVF